MDFSASKYHSILCKEFPDFLKKYLSLPLLTRLKGIGLLCGTDYTPLYSNRFFYSRYDHSVGCALIAWNFTRDKKQALASLLHDVSTPAFSHVGDFRKGDVLKQEATEGMNAKMILECDELAQLLKTDGLTVEDVCDYHLYPVCDNEIPALSSDRLEYMFPSGMALCDWVVKDDPCFDMESVCRCYNDICVLKNETGVEELGFATLDIAVEYTKRFCDVGLILQRNENKLALNMLGKILNMAIEEKIIEENDLYTLDEKTVLERIRAGSSGVAGRLYKAWSSMTKIERFDHDPGPDYYSVNLEVKKRYIDPLVRCADGKVCRVKDASEEAAGIIRAFLEYKDSDYGACFLP